MDLTAVIVVMLTSGGGLFLLRWAKEVIDRRRSRILPDEVSGSIFKLWSEVHNELSTFRSTFNAQRALILYAHNSGGPLHPAEVLKVTILHEDKEADMKAVAEYWKARPIDKPYVGMLAQVEREKIVLIKRATMGGQLQDAYKAAKLESGLVIEIGHLGKRYYYLSFSFDRELEITAAMRDYARNTAISLKDKLKAGFESG